MRQELLDLPQPNWFHHGERILALLDEHQPRVCVELGTNKGCSALAIARTIQTWGGELTCIDLWELLPWDERTTLAECRTNLAGVDNIVLIQAHTFEVARFYPPIVDFLYVDADHSREGCYRDLVSWWPALRSGALLAGDDYDDPHGNSALGVSAAWDVFERDYKQKFAREKSENPLGCSCYRCKDARLIWGTKH